MFYVYILYSDKGKRYYIGQTEDVARRLVLHNRGEVNSTRSFIPWTLLGYIEKSTRSESMKLERKLKNFNTEDLKRFVRKYLQGESS